MLQNEKSINGYRIRQEEGETREREQVENIKQLYTVHYQKAPSICFLIIFTGLHFRPRGSSSCGQVGIPLQVPFSFFLCYNFALFPGSSFWPLPYEMCKVGVGIRIFVALCGLGKSFLVQSGRKAVNSVFFKVSAIKLVSLFAFFSWHNHYVLLVYLNF